MKWFSVVVILNLIICVTCLGASIHLTNTQTTPTLPPPSPTVTSTPAPPTYTPAPPTQTPTPSSRLQCTISSNQIEYYAGDHVRVNMGIANFEETISTSLYVAMEVDGIFYFFDFMTSTFSEEIVSLTLDLPQEYETHFPFFDFVLPGGIPDLKVTWYSACISSMDDELHGLHQSRSYFKSGSRPIPGTTSTKVIGSAGGLLTLDDGCTLEIPEGAIKEDTTLTLSRDPAFPQLGADVAVSYQLEPSGLQLEKPAILRVNYDDPSAFVSDDYIVAASSHCSEHPIDEMRSHFKTEEVICHDKNDRYFDILVRQLGSYWPVVHESAYLVMELPSKFLKPGDLLYGLYHVPFSDYATWLPGHTALYYGKYISVLDRLYEARPHSVRFANYDVGLERTWIQRDNLFNLGARRHVLNQNLSDSARNSIAKKASDQFGDRYCMPITDDDCLGFGPDNWSAAGLTEEAYGQGAGIDIVPMEDEFHLLPLVQFSRTVPVSEIWVAADDPEGVRFPVRTIVWDLTRRMGFTPVPRWPRYQVSCPTHPNHFKKGVFQYKPVPGETEIDVRFEAISTGAIPRTVTQTLKIHVMDP